MIKKEKIAHHFGERGGKIEKQKSRTSLEKTERQGQFGSAYRKKRRISGKTKTILLVLECAIIKLIYKGIFIASSKEKKRRNEEKEK